MFDEDKSPTQPPAFEREQNLAARDYSAPESIREGIEHSGDKSDSLQPAFVGKLTMRRLLQLPAGWIIQSNACDHPFNPAFEVRLGSPETRKAVWQKMCECKVDGRLFRGFTTEAQYVFWIRERLQAMLRQRANYDTLT